MNSEFENYLSRQSFRPVPPEWRDEILRAAERNMVDAAPAPWWREWLWPGPKAWGALGAAWAVIFLLHLTAPSESTASSHVAPMTLEAFARLHQEMEMIAQLPDWPPPRPAAPQPRTCRDVKHNIG